MRVLLVEDQPAIAEFIKRGLEENKFEVETVFDGETGLQKALNDGYSVIILDIMLPKKDGWQICEAVRETKNTTPIIMLTARDSVQDRIRGLNIGADDYLPKPFDFNELLARVQALIRRDRIHKETVIHIADLEINTSEKTVSRGGKPIPLSMREYTLLEALAGHEGKTLTHDYIQEKVWFDYDSYSNAVAVHVKNLRKKIDANSDIKLIHTVHGLGYKLTISSDDE